MNYTDYINQIATMAVIPVADPNFVIIIPEMINYAELRIQRDLDFLATQFEGASILATSGVPYVTLDPNQFISVQTVVCVDYTQQSGIPINKMLLPVSKEFIQNNYVPYLFGPAETTSGATGQPEYFAMYGGDQATAGNTVTYILLGPCPNASYVIYVTGTQRAPTLSYGVDGTGTTYISTFLPDLFIMASMIYISAFQRNFGRQSDDPAMAQSYESQYQSLLKSATVEEFRKKAQSSGWTPYSPSPIATPSRG